MQKVKGGPQEAPDEYGSLLKQKLISEGMLQPGEDIPKSLSKAFSDACKPALTVGEASQTLDAVMMLTKMVYPHGGTHKVKFVGEYPMEELRMSKDDVRDFIGGFGVGFVSAVARAKSNGSRVSDVLEYAEEDATQTQKQLNELFARRILSDRDGDMSRRGDNVFAEHADTDMRRGLVEPILQRMREKFTSTSS